MDMTGAILLAVIGVVIGFLLGALVFSLRRERPAEQATRKLLLSDESNDLRLWREAPDNALVIEIEGATYRRESDLNPEQNRRLSRLINELKTFLRAPTPTPVPSPTPQTDSVMPAVTQPKGEEERPSLNPFQIFTRSLQPREKGNRDDLDKSIVAQIDEILQSSLEGTDYSERGIRLVEGMDQGMIIEVGLDRYTDIESVPDAEVRRLIRQAVSDWENKTGG